MPIASVVLTLVHDREPLRDRVLAELTRDPRIELGPASGACLPAVLDTASAAEGEALVQSLVEKEGVVFVDVVAVDFSDQAEET